MKYDKIRKALSDGLLSFPITDLNSSGAFDADSFADRLKWFASYDVSSVFVAGGTGEFFSLSKDEYQSIVTIAASTIKNVPIISSIGRSIPEAIEFAKISEDAGIDGLLLMPPYLTDCPKDGIVQYAKTIINATHLPVVYYNRANGTLGAKEIVELTEACPNLIGLKDGTGNMQELNETIKTVGDRLIYIGGVPTAEIISEAYLSIGVNTYSSAVFNFVPDLALLFYKSLRKGDGEMVKRIINDFFIPFVRLRGQKSGYAVSLIKAGAFIIGRPAGSVRAPLVMPNDQEIQELKRIIDLTHSIN